MTYCHNIRLAELEEEVLFNLLKLNAPVPRLITRKGHWLIQEYLEKKKLTQSLNTVSSELQCSLLESAIGSLAEIQRIAAEVGFHLRVKPICMGAKWRKGRINFPILLGKLLGIPAPAVDKDALFNALMLEPDTFVKWDARAGNAIIRKEV